MRFPKNRQRKIDAAVNKFSADAITAAEAELALYSLNCQVTTAQLLSAKHTGAPLYVKDRARGTTLEYNIGGEDHIDLVLD